VFNNELGVVQTRFINAGSAPLRLSDYFPKGRSIVIGWASG
jgi:hypothetical protein